jgi:hypothetical protein
MPTRAIFGQATGLSRGNHDVRFDPVRDELFSPGSGAILVFRGGANGQEAPLRVIQGPRTQIRGNRLDLDTVNGEIVAPARDSILVFPRDAHGDVAPIRTIQGPDTGLNGVNAIAVDPVHDLIIAAVHSGGPDPKDIDDDPDVSLLFFKRTDSGNVRPSGEIRIPNVGPVRNPEFPRLSTGGMVAQMQAYPEKGWIIVAVSGPDWGYKSGSFTPFVGIWSIHDRGTVAPRWKLGGPKSTLQRPRGVALIPHRKEMIISDMRQNAVLTFFFPEIF